MTGRVIRFGAFLVATLVLTVYIGATIQNVSFRPRYQLSASFTDVTGLFRGDPVKLAGVPVGQVASIHLVDGRALVRFSVDKSVKLPRDGTSVSVRWRNLIGQRDMAIDPGPNAATASAFLPTDGHGTITETRSAVDIGAVLSALGPLGKAIDPNQLNVIFTALAKALDGNGGTIDQLVTNLDAVSATLARRDQTIGQMLTDYNSVTGVLGRRDQEIQTMVQNVALLSQSFTDNTRLFESALGNLSSVGTSLDRLLTANEQQFKGVIDHLAVVAEAINGKLPQLKQAFGGVPAALKALFSTANGGDYLRVDVTCLQFAPAPCTLLGGYFVP